MSHAVLLFSVNSWVPLWFCFPWLSVQVSLSFVFARLSSVLYRLGGMCRCYMYYGSCHNSYTTCIHFSHRSRTSLSYNHSFSVSKKMMQERVLNPWLISHSPRRYPLGHQGNLRKSFHITVSSLPVSQPSLSLLLFCQTGQRQQLQSHNNSIKYHCSIILTLHLCTLTWWLPLEMVRVSIAVINRWSIWHWCVESYFQMHCLALCLMPCRALRHLANWPILACQW